MLDMHTHILPKIDDGSKSVEMSLEMIALLRHQGIADIMLTPHFYPDTESLQSFLHRREKAVKRLCECNELDGVSLYLGCETALTGLLFANEDLKPACLAGTDIMLTELSYSNSASDKNFKMLERLMEEYEITPLIAHLERYPDIRKSAKNVQRLVEMGCLIQLNASAFCGGFFGDSRWALKLLDRGIVSFIGSDCHNMSSRAPNIGDAVNAIKKKDECLLDILEKRSRKFLEKANRLDSYNMNYLSLENV